MPLTYVDKDHDTIDRWREKFNLICQQVIDLSNETGIRENLISRGRENEIPTSVADSYGHIQEKDELNENIVKSSTDIENFDFEVFADVVDFINDTNKDFTDITNELSNLSTLDKSSLSAAINWCVTELGAKDFTDANYVGMLNEVSAVVGDVGIIETDLPQILLIINLIVNHIGHNGNLLTLTTPIKTDLILSINSLFDLIQLGFANRDAVRLSFDGFDDDDSLTLVDKINKSIKISGDKLRLQTLNKTNYVSAISEIHDEIGGLNNLTTLIDDDIVAGINEKHHWKVMNDNIAFDDDVHILTTGTVLSIEEEYDFWVKEGHREQYNVWVRSSEKRRYRVWTSSGYRKRWNIRQPSGFYKTVAKSFASGHWVTTRTPGGYIYITRNYFDYTGWGFRRGFHLWHGNVIRRTCVKNDDLFTSRNVWWRRHVNRGWNGNLIIGGWGVGRHWRHVISHTKTAEVCFWNVKRKWVNTSTIKSTRVWVDTSKTVQTTRWIDTSHWVRKVKNVDTSHYEKRTRWIDTSHYEKRIRQIPQPDLPEIGLYLDGQVKSAGFFAGTKSNKYDLFGDVVGDVHGRIYGDITGTCGNWSENRQINILGKINGTWLTDGGSNKNLDIQNQLKFSEFIHDHDATSNYWKIGDDKQLHVETIITSLSHTAAWDVMVARVTQAIIDSWEIGQLVVIHSGNYHYLWMKSQMGWFYISGNTYNTATV